MPGFCCASSTGVPPRDIAASPGITDRSAHGIVTDLTAAGYVVKQKHGRRKRLPDPGAPPAQPGERRADQKLSGA